MGSKKAKQNAERIKRIRASAARAAAKSSRDKPREFRASSCLPLQITAETNGKEPKLATFAGIGYTGQPMRPEGWWEPIVVDLDGVRIPSQHRPALRQHDHEQIVGHTTRVEVTKKGIEFEGVFSGQKEHVEKVTIPAKNGFQWQLSIGANPLRTEFLKAGETTTVNGREITGPVTISRETDIGEITFCPLGADGDTSVTVSASAQRGKSMNKILLKAAMAQLRASGKLSAAKYSDEEVDAMDETEAKNALKKCMSAEHDPPGKSTDDEDEDDMEEPKKSESMRQFKLEMKAARESFLSEMRTSRSAEMTRQAAITAAVDRHGVRGLIPLVERGQPVKAADGKPVMIDLAAHAIANNWTEQQASDAAELHQLRANRPGVGVGVPGGLAYATSQPNISDAVIEAAVLQAANCDLFNDEFFVSNHGDRGRVPAREQRKIQSELKARYSDEVMQAAHKLFKGRIGLQQIFTTIAAANGHRVPQVIRDDGDLSQIIAATRSAGGNAIQADGASTASLANVTANVLNKFLLQGYLYTEQAYKEVAASRSVKDFKATKSINLLADTQFEEVGASGELKHAMLSDQAFANQAKTYGRIITISRTNIINDDLGALTQVPMLMGRGWGLKMNELFWSKFLNPGYDDGGSTNFFAATHTLTSLPGNQTGNSNVSTGTGSTLSSAGLTAAKLVFDNQIDPMGKPLGVDAEILLYPSDLDTNAVELMNAQFIIMAGLASTSAASKQPNTNIWKGRFKPVMSRYLNKASLGGNYSTAAWYLLANPAVVPVIEIAYLNGQESPTVQTAGSDFEFNILGMAIRAFFDAGVNMQNFRGAVRSAGS